MLHPYQEHVDSIWYESPEARQWAREAFYGIAPPPLHSEERKNLNAAIEQDIEKITDLCIESFWQGDDPTLHSRVEVLRVSILQKKATIALWRLLAPEILSNIFLFLGFDQELKENPFKMWDSRGFGPRHLVVGHRVSQVSRYWRDIAIGAHHCWMPIHLEGSGLRWELLELWLKRSGSIPLVIQIQPPVENRYFRVLRKHLRRWKSLKFSVTCDWSSNVRVDLQALLEQTKYADNLVEVEMSGSHCLRLCSSLPAFESFAMPVAKKLQYPMVYIPHSNVRGRVDGRPPVHEAGNGGLIGLGTYIRQDGEDEYELRQLDLTDATYASNNPGDIPLSLNHLEHVTLPASSDPANIEWLLEEFSHHAPVLSSITFSQVYAKVCFPPFTNLVSIRISLPANHFNTKFQLSTWYDAVPNLCYLSMGDILWVEIRAADTILETLYSKPKSDDFAWMKLDKARLYAWRDPWFICFAKRGPLSTMVEHPFSPNMEYLNDIGEYEFPYRVSLCWEELRHRVDLVREYFMLASEMLL